MFLSKRQESELITALMGRGEIPLKFAYLGNGANNWDKIASQRSETGGINSVEGTLLSEKIDNFLSSFQGAQKINVIDIGCGNGFPIFPVLEELERESIQSRYIPLDISKELLDLASRNVAQRFNKVEIKPYQLDFESGNFSDIAYDLREGGFVNFFFFLGSTLGNHSDRSRVLTNFRDSMTVEDYLLIGVEATNTAKINKVLQYYTVDAAKDFVFFIPEHIGIGRASSEFDVRWNDRQSQVEIHLLLKKDVSINIGKDNFKLESGETILVARSVKFSESTVTSLLSELNFRNEFLTTNKERTYVLSMVQPTRYTIS